MTPRALALLVSLVLGVVCPAPAAASPDPSPPSTIDMTYALVLPDGRAVTYELELDVLYPGTITVAAEWPGTRVIAFRLGRPGAPETEARRSGPSPQAFSIRVDDWNAGVGPWRLWIHSLPAGGRAEGRLTVGLPGPPSAEPRPAAVPEPDTEDRPAWALPVRAPSGSPAALVTLFERTEAVRSLVVEDEAPDACRWQEDFVRWLAERRDELAAGGPRPTSATRKLVERMVDMIHAVESLRVSNDPLLAGPGPADPLKREAWARTRRARLTPLAHGLDDVVQRLQGGHAPELEVEVWPSRMMICATAVERHFEQRGDVGEALAVNRDVAHEQWPRLLAAANALEALVRAPSWNRAGRGRPASVAESRASVEDGDPGLD